MGEPEKQNKPKNSEETLKESLNALHPAKPSENIAILDTSPQPSEELLEKLHETISFGKIQSISEVKSEASSRVKSQSEEKIEALKSVSEKSSTIKESVSNCETKKESRQPIQTHREPPANVSLDQKNRVNSAASGLNQGDRVIRNQSDIFSIEEQTSIATSIFSINGSPSRKLYRKKELPQNNVFPTPDKFGKMDPPSEINSPKEKVKEIHNASYNELKRPSSSIRNPLTGTGLSSNDEYKCKTTKRKDGNPLLGLGYSPEATPSTHRIPPGGYSHKLW